jgi:hypothetical protein
MIMPFNTAKYCSENYTKIRRNIYWKGKVLFSFSEIVYVLRNDNNRYACALRCRDVNDTGFFAGQEGVLLANWTAKRFWYLNVRHVETGDW